MHTCLSRLKRVFDRNSLLSCVLVATFLGAPTESATAQTGGFRPSTYALTGGNVVSSASGKTSPSTIIVRDGVIVAVAKDAPIPGDARKIDVTGLIVYPGLIDAATSLLLDADKAPKAAESQKVEFDKYILAATRRDNRKGLTPNFRAVQALKLEAAAVEPFRKLGFTSMHVLPSGRIASGIGTSIQSAGAGLADATLVAETWSHLKLYAPGGTYPATLMGCTAHLRQAFLDAQHYVAHWNAFKKSSADATPRPRVDQDLQELADILSGKRKVIFETNSNDDIHRALDFAAEFGIEPALLIQGDYERAIDRMIKLKASVLLAKDFGGQPKIETPTHADTLTVDVKPPRRFQQDRITTWTEQFTLLKRLFDAGLPVAFASFGSKDAQFIVRNIQTAAKNGVPIKPLLAAASKTPAELLGLGDRLGSIQVGKLAHLTVLTGPLEDDQSKVRHVFIEQAHFEYNEKAKPVGPKSAQPVHANVAGKWNLQIEGSSEKLIARVEFSQDKDRLTGFFESDRGNGKLTSGKVVDQKIEFAVSIGAGARSVDLQFNGTISKDQLTGKLRSPFGAETAWSAKRQPTPTAKNPVAIGAIESGEPNEAPQKSAEDKDQPSELESDRLAVQTMTGGNLLIKDATVLTGTRKTLSNTSIRIENGKIVEIGPNIAARKGLKTIDAKGRFVTPGLMDTHSHIMIQSGVNESTQSVVCEVGIKDVLNSQDVAEYRALAGGLTTARLLHGSANVIGGQDAVVKLKYGKSAREHLVPNHPLGVKFALGENVKFRTNRFPNTRLGVEATLQRAFLEAIDYRRGWFQYERGGKKGLAPRRDLRLEALVKIVEHEMFIHCHCYRADEILMLLRVATQHGFRIQSLQHVLEGYKVAPEIVAHGASCSTFADWWAYKVEAFDATPYNAALLHEAGANVVIKSDDAELIRHMYYEAAKPIRYGGMLPDAALQTVTLNSARELQLHDRLGSIEVGKDGDLAIFNGHPLDSFSRCDSTIIEGNIYFQRDKAPTAVTAAGRARIAQRPQFAIPSSQARTKQLDLSQIANGKFAIVGATLHPVDGKPIVGGTLWVENGRIQQLGK
ncbi:MAG: amidohydrolase family protein [Planctomycetota bacterium]|nr:amidohydrolase family protein [Planctomycetota bacterium]